MAERRYYRVAGHIFSLEAETGLLDMVGNYAPFLIAPSAVQQQDLRFALSVHLQDELPVADLGTPYFVDSSDDDMPRIEVYRHANQDWTFCVSMYKEAPAACMFHASHDFHEATLYALSSTFTFALNNAAMLLYAFSTASFATLEMHAAVIVRHGMGQLFLGKSGTGKSTHARLWLQAFPSAWLLNDDNPILRLEDETVVENGQSVSRHVVRVYGSPWSGKTPCYKNASAPVSAIVKLSQAPHNEMVTLRLPEAYAYMLSSASGLKIIPEMMDCLYDTISRMIQTISLYHLDCLPNTAAAELCYSTISKHI